MGIIMVYKPTNITGGPHPVWGATVFFSTVARLEDHPIIPLRNQYC